MDNHGILPGGNICLSHGTITGPWGVVLWGAPKSDYWYIYNVETGKFRKIGRVKLRG